jgi:serine phosphatase RsbU (regulator of sigma subunit)
VRYQYILEGYDNDWSPITNKTTATFGNIYEGSYTFKLKAQSPFGVWSEPITYTFKVLPPWWRTWWMYSVYVLILVSCIFLIVWWNGRRLRAKAIELTEEVRKATHTITEKQKEIIDSITYAKRIQRAMLPHRKDIWAAFPQSFVLFKPKDIVSGDFYFFHKNNQSVFIAVADCTGHGVPGAFMSMVGAGKLNDAVSQSTDTSEILSLLNKGIKTALKQSDSAESTRDGMDIALCSVDIENRIVQYAGANRPLWIIRKGQTEVEETKATKKAIGGLTEDNQHFESHVLKLQQGDTFYICTDGYADQFGGQTGKKLMTKKLKEVIIEIQNKSMKEQEQYLDNFVENWKAGTEQVDDILVIGIRI